jgi:hypothetical protein
MSKRLQCEGEPEMKKPKNWFEVDKDGLKALQLGKPKSYIIRELVANAWDENITICKVESHNENGITTISVEDDSPEGFKDIADSYTLFKHTSKRTNPHQRGRFNIGEKQVFAICRKASIETTKGTVTFEENGRRTSRIHRDKGTKVTIELRMTKAEYEEMIGTLMLYLSPKNITTIINGQKLDYKQPFKTITSTLQTELADQNGALSKTQRKTEIQIHKVPEDSYLYEMGIPVTKIDCQFSIDIQQKIPLDKDRENVSQAFLKDVYAEVLNATCDEIPEDKSSETWIRNATSDERISPEAIEAIKRKRFGDKVLVANPFDPVANDDAISHGYRVIQGRELSAEEWTQLKHKAPIATTTMEFGKTEVNAEELPPTPQQAKVALYAKKLHQRLNNQDLQVRFVRCKEAKESANFGEATLTFNIANLPKDFFDDYLKTTNLILHEIGHEFGHHTEHRYHEALTRMAQDLLIIALAEPEFFSNS